MNCTRATFAKQMPLP